MVTKSGEQAEFALAKMLVNELVLRGGRFRRKLSQEKVLDNHTSAVHVELIFG